MSPRRSMLLFLTMVLISASIVSALVLFLALQAQSQPRAEGINSQFGLKLTASLEKRVYRIGETVNMSLTLTNIGNQTISFTYAETWHRFDFQVLNGINNGIYQWSASGWFPQELDYITLNSGESLSVGQVAGYSHYPTQYYAWRQTCNNRTITHSTIVSEGVPVSPGTYYIVGQSGPIVEVNGKDITKYGLDKPLVIETTPIEIAIVDH